MSLRQLPNGRWQVRWYDASGRRRTESHRTKKLADEAETRHLDERNRGDMPLRRKTTLARYLEDWSVTTQEKVEASTWKHAYEPHLRLYIRPELGDLFLNQIDAHAVQRFIDGLAKRGLSAATRQRVHATLRAVLNKAAAEGYRTPLARNSVTLPQQPRVEEDVPTIAQIDRLSELIDPDYRAAVLLAGYCGLRAGEVWGLHTADIDWAHHRIRVRRSRENHSGREKTPKSGRARWVTMTAPVEEALRTHLDEYPTSALVFQSERGRVVRHSNFYRRVWQPAILEAGLPNLRFHSLRHAAPTIMAMAGWSAKRVQLELGHSTAAFTLDRYGHLFHEEDVASRERMNDVLTAAIQSAKRREAANG